MENNHISEDENGESGDGIRRFPNRRSLLKVGVAGILGGFTSNTVGASETPELPDTGFDPLHAPERRKFIAESLEISKDKSGEDLEKYRKNLRKELSKSQTFQLRRELSNIELKIEQGSGTVSNKSSNESKRSKQPNKLMSSNQEDSSNQLSSLSTSTSQRTTYTYPLTGYITVLGNHYKAFTYRNIISWNYDGTRVSQVDTRSSASVNSYGIVLWTYDSDDGYKRVENTYASSSRTGKFNRCMVASLSLLCVKNDFAYSRIEGNNKGRGRMVEREVY